MTMTDQQVRRLMEEMRKKGDLGKAADAAGMHRHTARKYVREGKLPSEMRGFRSYRTREDPFEQDWSEIEGKLEDAPELEAKTLFDDLVERKPERGYQEGQLRTLQRRVSDWRATKGPDRELFFPQAHRPGEAMQTDFTWGNELEVTIAGEEFSHLLCHCWLPYSNWGWMTVCQSESLLAIKRGLQSALFRLGRTPEFHQTDNSTAATHNLGKGKFKKRDFNQDYVAIMNHFGIKPRTTGIGKKEQNGDVEAGNGAIKRRLNQYLLLRRSRDFESVDAYEDWIAIIVEKANRCRTKRLKEDLAAMQVLSVRRLPEYTEVQGRVCEGGTIRIKYNTYSVPSRLRGSAVRVRIYEDHLEVYCRGSLQEVMERLAGRNGHRIDYRHMIWSMVRKPGAFRRYRYREDLYPSLTFRRAYDALTEALSDRAADLDYLRILHLAAAKTETEVEAALEILLEQGIVPRLDAVHDLLGDQPIEHPEMLAPEVDLRTYDELLECREVAS